MNHIQLLHCLFWPAVYFPLNDWLDADAFHALVRVFDAQTGVRTPEAAVDRHWRGLVDRRTGRSPWSSVVPPHIDRPSLSRLENLMARRAAKNDVENIVARRSFGSWQAEGILYTIDYFNPGDELGLGYRDAGEPVVAIPVGGDYRALRDRLGELSSFYALVSSLARALEPRYVMAAGTMSNVMLAFAEGRLSRRFSPWDFLYPLTIRRRDVGWPELSALRSLFHRAEEWQGDRVLLQVRVGLDETDIGPDYAAAAEALGLVATQELIPGMIEHLRHRLREP